ncbi:hypothetical protein KFE25_013130 [Diacronema lutheri]|uniref:AP2/ERF domain-containing protein n=2 Tax=Diacronema lutheri TaxID=2081491 RepID=A0A8J5XKK5_DIALT|nr:hypothetical protein KFE25_013130 [Diacronema lutheri]
MAARKRQIVEGEAGALAAERQVRQPESAPLHGVVRGAAQADGAEAPFVAQLRWQGTRYTLGEFGTALDAARAYDWAARMIGGGKPLNFAVDEELGEPPQTAHAERLLARVALKRAAVDAAAAGARGVGHAPRYAGVMPNKNSPSSPFKAVFAWHGVQYHLGSFDSALAAAKAHDWAARLVADGRALNFPGFAELGHPPRSASVDELRAALAETREALPARPARAR